MLKIVKSQVYSYDTSKPVAVGKVRQTEADEEAITEEDIQALNAERERVRAEDEQRRFDDAVKQRSDAIIAAMRKQVDAEYHRLISSGSAAAEKMISDAKVKTKAVFEATAEECEKLKERARHDGFEAGYEAGQTEALKKCEKYLSASAQFLSEINAKKESYFISHEYEMCETVMAMVKKITMSEIKTDPEIVSRIVANAAKSFRNSDYLKISVWDGQVTKKLVSDADFVKSLIPFVPEVEVEALNSEDAPEGTIVLDNGSEIIDASIPTQLDFLREIMKNSQNTGGGTEDNGT